LQILFQEICRWYRFKDKEEKAKEDDEEMQDDDDDDVEKPPGVWEKKWTDRWVAARLKRDEIKQMIGVSTKSERLPKYTKTLSEVMKGLDDETRELYKHLAEQWNRSGPPPDIQRRYLTNCTSNIFLTSV
jgi:hypothetical protein